MTNIGTNFFEKTINKWLSKHSIQVVFQAATFWERPHQTHKCSKYKIQRLALFDRLREKRLA